MKLTDVPNRLQDAKRLAVNNGHSRPPLIDPHQCIRVMPSFMYHLRHAPMRFRCYWIAGSILTCIALTLGIYNITRLILRGISIRRSEEQVFISSKICIYVKLSSYPLCLSVMSLVSLFLLRPQFSFDFVACVYEAACLIWIWDLHVNLLGGPAKAQALLEADGPRSVLPFSFMRQLGRERRWHRRDFVLSYGLVAQYFMYTVATAVMVYGKTRIEWYIVHLSIFPALLAMYGVLMLYMASKNHLKGTSIGRKFLLVKAMVFVQATAGLVLRAFAKVQGTSGFYSERVMQEACYLFWMNTFSNLMTLPFVCVFSVNEINPKAEEIFRGRVLSSTLTTDVETDKDAAGSVNLPKSNKCRRSLVLVLGQWITKASTTPQKT